MIQKSKLWSVYSSSSVNVSTSIAWLPPSILRAPFPFLTTSSTISAASSRLPSCPLPDRSAVVRAVRVNVDRKQQLPLGHVRFKVVISGVAADASDVAALICRLEDSPYFFQVVLSFSRSAELKVESILPASGGTPKAGADITVSEFEIHCDLGNYRLQ